MPAATIARLHRTLGQGLRALMQGEPWPRVKLKGEALRRLTQADPKRSAVVVDRRGAEVAVILHTVQLLVLLAGARLRSCLECREPFLAPRRHRLFCSPACGQRVRDRRRKRPSRAKR